MFPPTPTRATLVRLEADWNAAHQHGDAAALDRLFADDLVSSFPVCG
jgi:ketosteroid isomerase-like protein